MGYDLHITRRRVWSDVGDDITADEWLAYVRNDPELRIHLENGPHFAMWTGQSLGNEAWLNWEAGEIFSKNPDAALIEKMVAIARQLGATVQGDDGERYDGGGGVAPAPGPSAGERARQWLWRLRRRSRSNAELAPPPFRVGDHLRDSWGNEHVVIALDSQREHGLGVIKTRRSDGKEFTHGMFAHGLTPVATTDRDNSS